MRWVDRVRMRGLATHRLGIESKHDLDADAMAPGAGSGPSMDTDKAAPGDRDRGRDLGAAAHATANAGSHVQDQVDYRPAVQTRLAVVVGLSAAAAVAERQGVADEQLRAGARDRLASSDSSALGTTGVSVSLQAHAPRSGSGSLPRPRSRSNPIAVETRSRTRTRSSSRHIGIGLGLGMDMHPNALQHFRGAAGRGALGMVTRRRHSHEKVARARQRIDAGEALVALGAMAEGVLESGGGHRVRNGGRASGSGSGSSGEDSLGPGKSVGTKKKIETERGSGDGLSFLAPRFLSRAGCGSSSDQSSVRVGGDDGSPRACTPRTRSREPAFESVESDRRSAALSRGYAPPAEESRHASSPQFGLQQKGYDLKLGLGLDLHRGMLESAASTASVLLQGTEREWLPFPVAPARYTLATAVGLPACMAESTATSKCVPGPKSLHTKDLAGMKRKRRLSTDGDTKRAATKSTRL